MIVSGLTCLLCLSFLDSLGDNFFAPKVFPKVKNPKVAIRLVSLRANEASIAIKLIIIDKRTMMRHWLWDSALTVQALPLGQHIHLPFAALFHNGFYVDFPSSVYGSFFQVLTTEDVHVAIVNCSYVVASSLRELTRNF